MKKYISLLKCLFIVPLMMFYGCEEPDYQTGNTAPPALELEVPKVEFSSGIGSRTIDVTSSVRDWNFELANTNDATWLTVTKDGGLKLVLTANPSLDARQAKVIVVAGDLREELLVVQQGITPIFTMKPTTITFKTEGETISVEITTNVASDEWSVSVGEEYLEWCEAERTGEVQKEDGTVEYTVEVTAGAYTGFENRKGVVYIQSDRLKDFGLEPVELLVTQKAVTGTINLPYNGMLSIPKTGDTFEFTVTSPQQLMEMDINVLPSWITNAEATLTVNDDNSSVIQIKGEVEANTGNERTTTITFRLNENDKTAVMTISQEGGMEYEEIKLTAASFYSNASDPGEGTDFGALVDNNVSTYWHSSWRGNVPEAHYLVVDLGEEIPAGTNVYFSITSRDHANPNTPDVFELQGRLTPYDNWFAIKKYTALADGIVTSARATEFDFPVLIPERNFRYIRLEVTKCIRGEKYFNLSEFKFYKEKK